MTDPKRTPRRPGNNSDENAETLERELRGSAGGAAIVDLSTAGRLIGFSVDYLRSEIRRGALKVVPRRKGAAIRVTLPALVSWLMEGESGE